MKNKFKIHLFILILITAVFSFASCGPKDNTPKEHTAGEWIIDEYATMYSEGKRHNVCTECGVLMNEETIPTIDPSVGLSFKTDFDTKDYIVCGIGKCTDKDIVIPETYKDRKVIGISNDAFYGVELTSLYISKNIQGYGGGKSVEGWNKIQRFIVCPKNEHYASVDGNLFTKDLTKLIKYAVGSTADRYTIPEQTTSIGQYAFDDNKWLQSLTIPDSVTGFFGIPFQGCDALREITVGEDNEYLKSIDGILYEKDGGTLYRYAPGREAESFTVPEGVETIRVGAFKGAHHLKSVTLSDSVVKISAEAFSDCKSLSDVGLGKSLMYIEEKAFEGTDAMAYTEYYGVKYLGSKSNPYHFLYKAPALTTELEIHPDTVVINEGAFKECTQIREVRIPDSVVRIGDEAFYRCINLQTLYVGKSVRRIGNNAFFRCGMLKNISFSEGLLYIGEYAFANCADLVTVTLPDSVIEMGKRAFENCNRLTTVNLPDSLTLVPPYAFSDCNALKEVNFGSYTKTVGLFAFEKCTSLEYISFNEGVTVVGQNCFDGCTSLKEVNLPSTLERLVAESFRGCNALDTIVLPEGLKEIGNECFVGCKSLATINIPETVEKIGYTAFSGCELLSEIRIPVTTTSIGSHVFQHCISLETVYYDGTVEQWNKIERPIGMSLNPDLQTYRVVCIDGVIEPER